jgi:hypothetical protein
LLTIRTTKAPGEAIFENITVGNAHYWVKLQNQGNLQFKVVKAYAIKPVIDNKSAVFDTNTGLLTLPKIAANGIYYNVVLQQLSNGLFSLKSAIAW